jgi:hypothetical protein
MLIPETVVYTMLKLNRGILGATAEDWPLMFSYMYTAPEPQDTSFFLHVIACAPTLAIDRWDPL